MTYQSVIEEKRYVYKKIQREFFMFYIYFKDEKKSFQEWFFLYYSFSQPFKKNC